MFEGRLDGGSFGYLRSQTSSGNAFGPADYFITGAAQRADGYRAHSNGHAERGQRQLPLQVFAGFRTAVLSERQHANLPLLLLP
jgi:hypothetical protein